LEISGKFENRVRVSEKCQGIGKSELGGNPACVPLVFHLWTLSYEIMDFGTRLTYVTYPNSMVAKPDAAYFAMAAARHREVSDVLLCVSRAER